jgi:tRNA(Arg) A34 adenosine deaminase TadA
VGDAGTVGSDGRALMRPLTIAFPAWLGAFADRTRVYGSDEERMRLAIDLSRENVLRTTGGPFGAAVFESESGRLVSVGVNLVVGLGNSVLHAEVVALMVAERTVGSYTLGGESMPPHDLVTSCDPCAMCLGAALWSGVRRIVAGAMREDAVAFGFDEGPVFDESYRYLERRGVRVVRGVLREEARGALELYRSQGGVPYNG